MFKLLLILPALMIGSILLGLGALAFLPILALLPVVLTVGACVFAFSVAAGVLLFFVRIVGALIVGVGGLMMVGVGAMALFAGAFVALLLGFAVVHLALPILFIAGLIWLIHRASVRKPAQLAHG